MSNKFEQLLDFLVNEEMDKANDLFHQIVVEKSREIYENIISEEAEEEEQEDESVEENFGSGEEEPKDDFGGEEELGGDASDDMLGDVETDSEDEFGGEDDGGEPATKDDVQELVDELEELKAEFQALLAGEKHEEEENPDVHGGELDGLGGEEEADGEDSEEASDEEEADDEEADEAYQAFVREYREVVGKPYGGGKVAGKSEEASTNKTSVVSSAKGRPSTTADAGNIVRADKGDQNEKGKAGGLVGNVKGEFTGNHLNKVGGYKGDAFTKDSSGHGAEKKGSGEGSVNDKNLLKPYKQ